MDTEFVTSILKNSHTHEHLAKKRIATATDILFGDQQLKKKMVITSLGIVFSRNEKEARDHQFQPHILRSILFRITTDIWGLFC